MLTMKKNVCKLNDFWCCTAIIGLTLIFSPDGHTKPIAFTYRLIVDTNTQIPGGTGKFISFTDPFTTTALDSRPASSIENGIVVFSGSGAFGQKGVYARSVRESKICVLSSNSKYPSQSKIIEETDNTFLPKKGAIIKIADTKTMLPNKKEKFRLFGTPSLSKGKVVFSGSSVNGPVAQGAYLANFRGKIITVVDRNTQVPGGIGIFRGIGNVSLDKGKVAFVHASRGIDRLFVANMKDQISFLADGTFNGLSFHDGIVAFIIEQTSIFAARAGNKPFLVADGIPGGGSIFYTGFNPSVDKGNIAFLAYYNGANSSGIFNATLKGSIIPVAVSGMPMPGGLDNFANFDSSSPSQRDGIIAFLGFGTSGQEGIYASIGGSLTKIIDLSDSLDGKILAHLYLGYEAVSGNQITFAAQFADGTRGLYVAHAIK